jgi:hypothetical protein
MDCSVDWTKPSKPVWWELCAELRHYGIGIGITDTPNAEVVIVENDPYILETAIGTEATVVFYVTEPVFMEGHPSHDRVMGLLHKVHALVAGTPRIAQHLEKLHPFVRVIPVPVECFQTLPDDGPPAIFHLPPNEWSRCSLPNPALEIMASGRVAICSDLDPYRGIITHEKDGFLCQDLGEMEECMRFLLTDSRICATMGFMTRATASKFNAKSVADQWVSLFQEVRPR